MASTTPSQPARRRAGIDGVLIAAVASLATALVIFTWHDSLAAAKSDPVDFAVFFVLTAALMLLAVDIYGKGSIRVAGVTLLATGFTFGVGAGVLAGIFAAGVHAVRRRSKPHKALFNAATFAIAAGAGAADLRGDPALELTAASSSARRAPPARHSGSSTSGC